MSSTSSTEQKPKSRSATDALAGRYRHLFVLPPVSSLLVYGGVSSFALSLISRGTSGIFYFVPVYLVLILSGLAISSGVRLLDRKSIVTFRRTLALLFAGGLLWLVIAVVGAAYAQYSGTSYPLTNAVLFGAFVCAGFEFLVVEGAFQRNVAFSAGLAALHPTATLLLIRWPELSNHFDAFAALGGALTFALFVSFPLILRRKKTSLGYDALSMFQAFMMTWTEGNPDVLESMIADHSEDAEVTTKVVRLGTDAGDIFLILPGVHPGPFHPVGSYDLPGVVSRAFEGLGPAMTLHRPGGHERNLATRAETARYAGVVRELAQTAPLGGASLRGPTHAKVGDATVSATAFDSDLIVTISFAPLGSDDIDTSVEAELAGPASQSGFDLSIVDAHNSINPDLHSPATGDPRWKGLFEDTKGTRPETFEVAYSHSDELGFPSSNDLTENGIALLMVKKQSTKSVLVLADANNSVPDLRSGVEKALAGAGFNLIEFCTSDSHNLAARGLTAERGYKALGEVTPPQSIAQLAVELARRAESRLAPARYGSVKTATRVKVFGSKSLEEFAALTQASSRLAWDYFRFAGAATAVLLLVSLFF